MTTALGFPLPSPVASLDSYIQTVNRFPLLTQERESELAWRWKRDNEVEAARELVLSHLRVVVAIARGYLGYGLPQADLIQEGNIGLMKAVKRFDPERGVRLVSFAVHWIKAEMHEFILRNWRIVKVATTKAQRKLFFNLRSMKQGFGALGRREAKRDGPATLGVKPEEVVEMETRLGGQDVALEPHGDDDDEESYAPDRLLATRTMEPGRILEHDASRAPAIVKVCSSALGETRSAQPPHHRGALARAKGHRHPARAGGRVRRLCRAHPPDRAEGDAEDEGPHGTGRLTSIIRVCARPRFHPRGFFLGAFPNR